MRPSNFPDHAGKADTARLHKIVDPLSFMVLLDPRRLGRAQARVGFGGVQLSIVYQPPAGEILQASVYDLSAVLRSDILGELPFCATSLPNLAKLAIPAFLVVQIFYPDSAKTSQGWLRWSGEDGGGVHIDFRESSSRGGFERLLARKLLGCGYLTAAPMWKYPVPGQCYHYAGTLPMRRSAEGFECEATGKLAVSLHTYVVDAANFPSLPSKNLTFTAMANALRIAARLKARSF